MKNKLNRAILLVLVILLGLCIIPNSVNANNDIIVALDPGHGGTETGAIGGNLVEKNLTWKIATKVKEILDRTQGITGILTKENHETLGRKERADRAKNNNADLLVSFHINSNDSSSMLSGAEVYVTHNTKQKRYYEYSNKLGLDVLQNLRNVGVKSFAYKPKVRVGTPNDVYPDGTIADYYGIISWPMHNDIPAVLIEHAFINNPHDRENYLNDTMLAKMAEADAKAIIDNKELFRRQYYGEINTGLKTMQIGQEADGRKYIKGEIDIAEWIDGVANTPKDVPQMTIKSTDGSFTAGFNLTHNGGLSYSYYRIIDNLDINKEYYLEAKLTTNKNISTKKTQTVNMLDMKVGEYKGTTLTTKNNKLYFSLGEYVGDINTDLKEINLDENTISGDIYIAEWIDGEAKTPIKTPILRLKSTDNTINIPIQVSYESGLDYKYNVQLDNIDLNKHYYIEANLIGEDNIGNNKTQTVKLPSKTLGEFKGRTLILEDNKIKPIYIGEINTDLKTINLSKNEAGRNYIYGEILIAEWINNQAYTPDGLPEMTLKSLDGSYSAKMYVNHLGGLNYYYDRIVDNLDPSKDYEIEVKLTGINNKGTKKTQIAKLPNKEIGKCEIGTLVAQNNKIKILDSSLYKGDINTDLQTMYIDVNSAGREYIYGNILIAEWVGQNANTPDGLPEMTLKSLDGSYSAKMYVRHEGGLNYYYDRVIWNLDTSKEYYIEVKLTGNKNIGTNKVQNANLNVKNQIGTFKDKNTMIQNNNIVFKGNEYKGEINTDLQTMYVDVNDAGREYIYGNILIAEWINGNANTPNGLPEMILKSTDGSYSAKMYVKHRGGLNYYYDRVIWNLDTSKEYYIEVKLTNLNNISNKKTQQANIKPTGEIETFKENYKMVLKNNKITFETIQKVTHNEKTIQGEPVEKPVQEEITQENMLENEELEQKDIQTEQVITEEPVVDSVIEENSENEKIMNGEKLFDIY